MPFIFSSDDVEGSCFHFLENGDNGRTEMFLTKPVGGTISGTLALQIFDNRDYRRLTFVDTKNLLKATSQNLWGYWGMMKSKNLLGILSKGTKILSRNDLCHFDFNENELKEGKKLLRFECMLRAFGMTGLMCYDFNTYNGCSYLFPSKKAAEKWGCALGIHQIYLYDLNDEFDSIIEF